jgi:hypothetical protein
LLAHLENVYPAPDQIEAFEQTVDDFRIEREVSRWRLPEQILGDMDEARQRRHVEQPGRAFQRVDRAEHIVDDIRRIRVPLEGKHHGACLLQQLASFGNELGEQRVHADVRSEGAWPVINRQRLAKFTGSTALTISTFAPAAWAWVRSASRAWVEIMIAGTARRSPERRNCLRKV